MKNPCKILIVDDEPYNSRVLKLKFENAGYKVVTAVNGLDGLKKFKSECPDVVISDIKMPVMNGEEMCRALKDASSGRLFLTVVVTSVVDKTERSWINEMDNIVLIEKPFSPSQILTIVEDYLYSKGDKKSAIIPPSPL